MICECVPTQPFSGQKPGTSGLRKKVSEFLEQDNYAENFIQCILDAVEESSPKDGGDGVTLLIGGDGRYGVKEACKTIIQMAAANKISKIVVAKDGLMSTPAISHYIRSAENVTGAIILTASHNPGGKEHGDFGIKYNMSNGGPAPSSFTERVYELTKSINEYKICKDIECNLSQIGKESHEIKSCKRNNTNINYTHHMEVEVIDGVTNYVTLMKSIFDFNQIKDYIHTHPILINSMHGITGPYVEKIFGHELGAPLETSCLNITVLEDFGGGHPDPNLTYAAELVDQMKRESKYEFGAAFDGDGDRNMILGRGAFFVTPCDSLAVIGNNLECIPYFRANDITGFARSMPTSGAIDLVAKMKNVNCYETPTGWKFFGNLLDANKICLCGEESFGTGSNHIREKDGIWASLAFLQILASKGLSVEQLLINHWKMYGRNFFTRYDYENCESEPCQEMMSRLQMFVDDSNNVGKCFESMSKMFIVKSADNFSYVDPIDGSNTTGQGIRIFFECGSRIVFRLSGTGSSGSTVRMYVDSYESDQANHVKSSGEMLAPCVDVALRISDLQNYTGRHKPTVIT